VAAAAEVSGLDEIVVVGSQAILGPHPDAPDEMLRSQEADVYPLRAPEKADEIDGALGDGSPFHEAYGFYARGVGPETAKGPAGWEQRLIRIAVPRRANSRVSPEALCIEPHDLVLAKCVRGEQRDLDFASAALAAEIVDGPTLLARIDDLPVDPERRRWIRSQLEELA